VSASLVLAERDPNRRTALLRLNRPEQRNALNQQLMDELVAMLEGLDADDGIGCIVLTGNEQAFAAGGDLGEMEKATPIDMLLAPREAQWRRIRTIRKPTIAAVAGWCLGGGTELAMTQDIVIAAESARFGLPEVKAGLMPGAGGTQRLVRDIGKSRAMKLLLTGDWIDASTAAAYGIAADVVPDAALIDSALELAALIAARPPLSLRLIKEAARAAYETGLEEGLVLERRLLYLLFASEDFKEGVAAFRDRRAATFSGR
jgi:enoyl-CoA hydratase